MKEEILQVRHKLVLPTGVQGGTWVNYYQLVMVTPPSSQHLPPDLELRRSDHFFCVCVCVPKALVLQSYPKVQLPSKPPEKPSMPLAVSRHRQ